jgi:predicted RNA binding protein YcfA (HicA-like mRNA interferase family)
MSTSSEYRFRVYQEARGLGWVQVRTTGRHAVWRHPVLRRQITLATTASDRRGILNALARLRRMNRGELR